MMVNKRSLRINQMLSPKRDNRRLMVKSEPDVKQKKEPDVKSNIDVKPNINSKMMLRNLILIRSPMRKERLL